MFACGIGAPPDAIGEAKASGKTTLALIGSPHHVSARCARASRSSGARVMTPVRTPDPSAPTRWCRRSWMPLGTSRCWPRAVSRPGVTSPPRSRWARRRSGWAPPGCSQASTRTTCTRSNTASSRRPAARDTVITRSESGKTFRQVRTAWSQEWEAEDAPEPLKMPYQDVLVGDLLGAIEEHDIEPLIHSGAGQSIAYFDEVRPAAAIMAELVSDTIQALGRQAGYLREP